MRITEEEMRRRLSSSRNLANLSAPSLTLEVPPFDVGDSHDDSTPEPTSSPSLPGSGSSLPPTSGGSNQLAGNTTHELIHRGRTKGAENVPEKVRDQIAILASIPGADLVAIAQQFGVSRSAVDQYKSGRVGNKPATEARAVKLLERQEAIKDVALTKLMGALGLCDEEKMSELSAKELGRFANDMARVVTAVSPASSQGPPINFIVYTPEGRSEDKYKTIDV